MTFINDFSKPIKFLVGMNGSGKSYALNEALKEQEQWAFLITEDGMPIIPRHMNQVSINLDSMSYNYLDEGSRGQLGRETEEEDISEKAQRVISFCNEIIRKLNLFITKSKGQEKLYNMMSIFTSYNLNHVRVIYFDEPENFLDEEFLKVIADFFDVLINSDYIVRVATHNSRLLNILKVNLEDVIFFHTHSQFLVAEDEIKEIFQSSSNQIERIREQQRIQTDASIQYKLDLLNHEQAFNSFIEQNLKSEEFYRSLFYKKIIIVEGISDIVALASMKNDFDSSIEIYNPNGKAFIPFFVQLFLKLRKEVIVIIDGDIPIQEEDTLLKHPVAITHFLKEFEARNEIKLVIHTPDLEGFYNIDLEQIGGSLGMSNTVRRTNKGWLKFLAAFIFFSEEVNKERLRGHVLGTADENQFQFQ
ncbi:TOPRIM nucleotidyl transferase/hydrolase domain-containing protein [Paenibacillus puldeungensis]|uniref:TOPRIM nucleotidyl transferase/hydrolase domain-containing protein n=1 Tax=Paenibacillus puldeungensis TaxID=696536 RepID=A0ABW3S1G9_9BACL